MGKLVAWVSLAACAVVVIVRRGDGVGGDTADYLTAARDLTGPSRFPSGLPFLLAPFTDSMLVMRAVMLTVTLALVGCIWWAAVKLGGWRSGAAAGVLMLLSPSLLAGGDVIMADRLGALTVVGSLVALLYGRPWLAGVLVGMSGWMRLVHVAFVAALPRRSWLPAGGVVVALVVWQIVAKGSLLGYTSDEASFALGNVTGPVGLEMVRNPAEVSNLVYFPAVLTAGFGGMFAPGLLILGVMGLRRNWGTSARFTAYAAALNLLVYLPYFFQSARFVLPAGCLLTVYAAALFGSQKVSGERRVFTRCEDLVEEENLVHSHAGDRVGPKDVDVC